MFLRLYTGVSTWWNDLKTRAEDEGGATAVEYALMVALIAVVTLAAGTKRLKTVEAAPKTAASLKENVTWAKQQIK